MAKHPSHPSHQRRGPDGRSVLARETVVRAFAAQDFHAACRQGLGVLGGSFKDTELVGFVGVAAEKIGRTSLAEKYLTRALRAQPMHIGWLMGMAETRFQQGELDRSLTHYDRVLALRDGFVPALVGRAVIFERRGEYEAALAILDPIVKEGAADPFTATLWTTVLQDLGRHEQTVDVLLDLLKRGDIDRRTRTMVAQRAGRALEKLGRFDEAFEAIRVSNETAAQPYSPSDFEAQITDLIETFSPSNLAGLARPRTSSARPVFVATLPRSGSTLCEQIVHSHGQGFGAGEITDLADLVRELPEKLESLQVYPDCLGDWSVEAADSCAAWYLDRLTEYDGAAARVVNKHLDNWMHLGMVSLVFPGAKVFCCTREAVDNCFSIYMASMNAEVYPWSTSLENIAHAYSQFQRIMDHWRDTLDLDFLDVRYEEVVESPEEQIRRVVSFLGLPWDERCLAFHEAKRDVMTLSYDQVRRPIYRSALNRSARYGDLLNPLREALQRYGCREGN